MKGLLSYVAGDSLLHRLDPLTKLLLAVLLCAASFTSTSHLFLLGLIALNLFLGWSAGIFRQTAAILSKLMGLSVFMFLLQLLFIRDGEVLFTIFGFAITGKAVYFGSLMVLRLVAATMPLTIMLSVTQMNDLSNVLVQKLHIPYKYAFTITTAIRFIPYFSDEMAGIMEAQTARGVEFDTKNVFKKLRMILPLCAPLLITSVKKTDTCAIAAEIRGFHLRKPESSYRQYAFTAADWLVTAGAVLLPVLAVLVNLLIAR